MLKIYITIFLLSIIYVLSTSFSHTHHSENIKQWLNRHYDDLELAAQEWSILLDEPVSQEELRQQYRNIQGRFRKIQFLLEYISE